MARARSPGYPNISLSEAISRVRKIHEMDRRNPLERKVIASHMGYSGLSGAADTAISALMHYGLLERVGKGEVRVSQLSVELLHPETERDYATALQYAASSPELFKSLRERFPDSRFSESALRSYLIRSGFVERAVDPAIRAFSETCRFLEQEGANESGGVTKRADQESERDQGARRDDPSMPTGNTQPPPTRRETELMVDERVLTTGLLSKEANFRLIVNGRIGVKEIERLIKKLELDKEILADAEGSETGEGDAGVFG